MNDKTFFEAVVSYEGFEYDKHFFGTFNEVRTESDIFIDDEIVGAIKRYMVRKYNEADASFLYDAFERVLSDYDDEFNNLYDCFYEGFEIECKEINLVLAD